MQAETGGDSHWYIDSGCSRHMTGNKKKFLSLESEEGGTVSFGDNKKGAIVGIGKVGNNESHSIENVFLVDGLKFSLLSVSQMCDRGNSAHFFPTHCFVKSIKTGRIVLRGKRWKNVYVTRLDSLASSHLTCLSVSVNDPFLWHKRLGHVNLTHLGKLSQKGLVKGLPLTDYVSDKLCDACVKGKQTKSSFKSKNVVSTSEVLELLHLDLCGPMRVRSFGGSWLVMVIVDDYSRFTWTIFLSSKDHVFENFEVFAGKVQKTVR